MCYRLLLVGTVLMGCLISSCGLQEATKALNLKEAVKADVGLVRKTQVDRRVVSTQHTGKGNQYVINAEGGAVVVIGLLALSLWAGKHRQVRRRDRIVRTLAMAIEDSEKFGTKPKRTVYASLYGTKEAKLLDRVLVEMRFKKKE